MTTTHTDNRAELQAWGDYPGPAERLRSAANAMRSAVDEMGGPDAFVEHCVEDLGVDEGVVSLVVGAGLEGPGIVDAHEQQRYPIELLRKVDLNAAAMAAEFLGRFIDSLMDAGSSDNYHVADLDFYTYARRVGLEGLSQCEDERLLRDAWYFLLDLPDNIRKVLAEHG